MKKIGDGEKVEIDTEKWSYADICKKEIYVLPACDSYVKTDSGLYVKAEDDEEIAEIVKKKAIKLKITGVIRPKDDNNTRLITTALGYTKALTDYLIDYAENSDVVQAQKADDTKNVINGMSFDPKNDEEKIADVKRYFEEMGVTEKAKMIKTFMSASSAQNSQMAEQFSKMTEEQMAAQMDMYLKTAPDKILLTMYDNYISPGDYEDNLTAFGVVSLDAPSSIAIYADSFENKDNISNCIEEYNKKAEENDKITYTDYVGLLMSSVTTIVNVISYVLIAFVAVSLIVSSIMIGIITYISVLERTKEIGILRAIGASKKNISQVFNAETFIIGLCSGLIGIGLTLLILIPGNAVIHSLAGTNDVSAALPPISAVILIALSIVLTLIGGLIPAKKAAKQDPVKALRTD